MVEYLIGMEPDDAKKHLGDAVKEDGSLYDLGWYLGYRPGNTQATLDGEFSADDLEAIAVFMRASQKQQD